MNVYKGNKMKTILIILFLELGILGVQAEYNPNNSSSAKNLSEISDYLQINKAVPLMLCSSSFTIGNESSILSALFILFKALG